MLFELTVFDFVAFGFGVLFLLAWLVFYGKGKKDAELFEDLNNEDYPVHEIYFIGYAVTQTLGLEYKSKADRLLRKNLSALYESKYADYYMRVVYSQRITMAMTLLTFSAPLYFFTGSPTLFVLMLAGAVAAYFYYGKATQELIKRRQEEYLSDFSDVVSKLALLVNSGMILVDAWDRVAYSKEKPIYMEMQRSVVDIRNGRSFSTALSEFGQRCMLPEIRKFASTVIQGLDKANSELSSVLIQQSREVWETKKQLVQRKGAMANDTLLAPMFLTFIGILIMVMVPIFANLGI